MTKLKNRKQIRAILLVFTALFVGITIFFYALWSYTGSVLTLFDFKALDIFYKLAVKNGRGPAASFAPAVVYLNITDETYNFFDKNYLDRKDMASLNNALVEMSPEAVIYDIIFARRSSEASDSAFSQSLENLGNVYLPTAVVLSDKPYKFRWKEDAAHERLRSDYLGTPKEIGIEDNVEINKTENSEKHNQRWGFNYANRYKPFYGVQALTQQSNFALRARGSGDISAKADSDGIYRHITMIVKIDEKYFPTLSLSVFLDWAGISLDDITVEWGKQITIPASKVSVESVKNIITKDVVIPIDRNGAAFIPFVNVMGRDFQYMSANAFLTHFQDENMRGNLLEIFEGNFVFVGDIAIGTSDLGYTPLQNDAPLVITHSSLLNAMLANIFYSEWQLGSTAILVLLILILMVLVSILRSSWFLYGAGFIITIFIPLFTWHEFISFRLFPAFTALFTLLIIFFIFITTLEMSGAKERAFIRNTFARYVPEKVVNALLAQPEMVALGGEERVITVLFSDIANFTTISESLSPTELVNLLNEYFTEMSDIIMQNGGIIDKFQGDSIMAEFGVPLPVEDHADRAVAAALQMLDRLAQLREIWKSRYEIYCRIGINTNNMIVGNMGSKNVLDYTVIGDAVNLASRLEGANKNYGTYLMISEFTHACLTKGRFKTRIVDYIKVKGKTKPVRVYEVYGTQDQETPEDYYINYHKGFEAYLDKNFTRASELFNRALSFKPNDKAATQMLERIEALKSSPNLDSSWDGSIALMSK